MNKVTYKFLVIISICTLFFIGLILLLFFIFHKEPVITRYVDSSSAIENYDKGFIVVGNNDKNDNHYSKPSVTLYNYSREKVLDKVYNKGYNGNFNDVIVDGDSFVAVGYYEASKSDLENSTSTALIVKYNKSLDIVFESDYEIKSDSMYTSVRAVEDGYIVCGYSESEDGAILVKYDKDGNSVWKKQLLEYKESHFVDLEINNDDIYVVGYADNNGLLLQYNHDGELIKTGTFEANEISSLKYTNGCLYVVGTKDKKGLIVSFDSMFTKLNEFTYDTLENSSFNNLITDDRDYLIVTGSYITKTDNNRTSNSVIIKLSSDLNIITEDKYVLDKNNYFKDLVFYDDKFYVISEVTNVDDNIDTKFLIYSLSLKKIGVNS